MPDFENPSKQFPVEGRSDEVEKAHQDLKHKRLIPTSENDGTVDEKAEDYRKKAQVEVKKKLDAKEGL